VPVLISPWAVVARPWVGRDGRPVRRWPRFTLIFRNATVSHRHGLFRRTLDRENTRHPRTVVTDRLKSCPGALRETKRDRKLWRFSWHRRDRWLITKSSRTTGA
jgi:hypothetical protein